MRIAMTVAAPGKAAGYHWNVADESWRPIISFTPRGSARSSST
ncbi:MAG: hypothetical protein R3E03_00580 [Novosphingobium sp.]